MSRGCLDEQDVLVVQRVEPALDGKGVLLRVSGVEKTVCSPSTTWTQPVLTYEPARFPRTGQLRRLSGSEWRYRQGEGCLLRCDCLIMKHSLDFTGDKTRGGSL